jgi:glycosyltransferase involved in cell wall biosynthesis
MPLPKGRTWFGHKKNCSMAGLGYTQTLLAAMSCQLGWTITRRPGVEELVPDGFERFLFSPSNEKELSKNVIELLNNEQMRKEFGVLSRQKVCQIANWETNALKMEDSLRQLVDRQGCS